MIFSHARRLVLTAHQRCGEAEMFRCAALAVMIVLLVVATLAIAGMLRGYRYWRKFCCQRYERIKLSEAYDSLKTGDLILFVATTHGFTNSFLTMDVFSHVGLVVEDANNTGHFLLSESTLGCELMPDPDNPSRELMSDPGASLAPLLARLKFYSGQYCLMSLSEPLPPDRKRKLEQLVKTVRGFPYPGLWDMLRGLCGFKVASRHCYLHVGWLLDQVGLSPAAGGSLYGSGFLDSSRRISNLAGTALGGGEHCYYYHEPRFVLYDLGLEKMSRLARGDSAP